jgi:integrase
VIIDDHLRWLSLEGKSSQTIAERRRLLIGLHRHLGTPLLAATEDDILGWREAMTWACDATILAYTSHIASFYTWAIDRGLIDGRSPAARIPRPRIGRRHPRPISTDDLFRALDSAPQPIRLWLVLAAWAGLRCKEIALLRRDCIQETAEEPTVFIAGNATKGRHERIVPLAPFAVDETRAAGLPASGWAFRRRDGKPGHNTPTRVSQITNDYLHSLGIAATMHTLRHWFGTGSWRATHDLRVVQEMLGHADPATTALYADWDRPAAAAAVGALPVPGRWLSAVR